jgi:sirohydrochlorin cobaltochelatase
VNKDNKVRNDNVGVILFAHGSRDPAWRKPFERLLKDVKRRGERHAVLAFGEFMVPDMVQAARQLALAGVTRALIVPLFLGGGSHVRSDVPRLAREAAAASGLRLRAAKAIGEDAGVLAAIADYSISAARPRSRPTSGRRKPS